MFKRPFKVELDTKIVDVHHHVTVSPIFMHKAENLVKTIGKTAVVVITVAAIASTTSDIAKHTAKTRIK